MLGTAVAVLLKCFHSATSTPIQSDSPMPASNLKSFSHACRQVVGDDFHVSGISGAQNMETDAEDFGIDASWVQSGDSLRRFGSSGKAGDPTAVVLNSQHVHFRTLGSTLLPVTCFGGLHCKSMCLTILLQ